MSCLTKWHSLFTQKTRSRTHLMLQKQLLLLVEILRAGFQYPRLVNPLVPVLVPTLVVNEVLEIPGVAGLGILPRLDALGLVQQGAMIAKDLQVRNKQMIECGNSNVKLQTTNHLKLQITISPFHGLKIWVWGLLRYHHFCLRHLALCLNLLKSSKTSII